MFDRADGADGRAQEVGGVGVLALVGVRVEVHGDARLGVAQALEDDGERDADVDQGRGAGVAEAMEGDPWQAGDRDPVVEVSKSRMRLRG